jgi:2-dehydro-3-deoxygalactonokinase
VEKKPEAMTASWIAIDWGTTNRRAYAMSADGHVVDTFRDDRGILSVSAGRFPAELAVLRETLGDLPAIAAGTVGAAQGWLNVPYVAAPASLADLAAALVPIAGESITIVPGVSFMSDGRCDVMRGEEVQALGAVAAGLVPGDALLCQPGTHNKWVHLEQGRIMRFTTAMTGEMFALLTAHSLLRDMLKGEAADDAAFREGVADAADGCDLLSALFGVRASVLLGKRAAADGASYASGLLIGADVAARLSPSEPVHILADAKLIALYQSAIALLGGQSHAIDSHAAFTAGMAQIRELAR